MKKILVANRGEIALRVMRTCREMGISTVAVFSEADRNSPHVKYADEAFCIGPPASSQSYLVADKIIEVAKQLQVDGIHPGYGFLSENAAFSDKVKAAGITFIGPSGHSMRMMGDKLSAKAAAKAHHIPLVPGSDGAVSSVEEAREVLKQTGFPVLIKASAGGGGKGMRIVEKIEDFEEQMKLAVSEATSAFGDGAVFIERYVAGPRHIEIQVMADNHGGAVYLFERECSVQRRHQKVVEESPSVAVTPAIRKEMGEAAARMVQEASYTNDGTLEFLLDARGEFYYMEVNTRLQVEHPVTEMVTGVDFVEHQLRIAAGEPLQLRQEDYAVARGAAIECRVCAEDVFNEFLPDTGIVSYMSLPEGEGIRNDTAVYEGYEVSVHYDPMVAKLIVHAEDRNTCIDRTIKALDQYQLVGLKTTIPFCRIVLDSEPFRSGKYNTFYVKEHWPQLPSDDLLSAIASMAAFGFSAEDQRRQPLPTND